MSTENRVRYVIDKINEKSYRHSICPRFSFSIIFFFPRYQSTNEKRHLSFFHASSFSDSWSLFVIDTRCTLSGGSNHYNQKKKKNNNRQNTNNLSQIHRCSRCLGVRQSIFEKKRLQHFGITYFEYSQYRR